MHPYSIMYQNIVRKGLLLFNYVSSVKQYFYHGYEHVKQCLFNYDYSLWIFLSGHSLPLPLSVISNPVYDWKYDTYTTQLIRHTTAVKEKYILSVLSAKLLITHNGETKEYDMDPFLETFSVYTDALSPPTLNMIVLSWCAHHNIWFPADYDIHMEYFDHLGNFIKVQLTEKTLLTIQQRKLYITST